MPERTKDHSSTTTMAFDDISIDNISIGEEHMTWYQDNGHSAPAMTTTGPIAWPNSQRGQSFGANAVGMRQMRTSAHSKSNKKYKYESDSTFQLALQYFNRKWQRPVNRHKKPGRMEDQEIYMERINYFNANVDKIIECRKCRDEVNGHRYYVNENKQSDILCYGCMARKLKKEVGTDASRLQEELLWLDERDLDKKYPHQWSFKH